VVFGTELPNSLINPNQIQAYGIGVYDDPFDTSRTFGIDSDQAFIPFDTTGTVVHFESCVPTEWEKTHLPIILLTSEDWNPSQEVLRNGDLSREFKEMRTIQSLTSGMTTHQINAIREEEAQGGRLEDNWVQSPRPDIELQYGMIPCTLTNPCDFTERLLSAVNIATARKASRTILNLSSPDDPIVTKYMEEKKASSTVSNE
jgi:hypothetical protein